jgi:ribonuclease P protein component
VLDRLSFSPEKRIREKTEFQKIFKERKRLYTPLYILYYRQNDLPYPRLGVITSRRNIRFAVHRNTVRRVARETFRHHQAALMGKDIVIVAQKKAGQVSKCELHQCLEKLFIKFQNISS